MKNSTREKFNKLKQDISHANGVSDPSEKFNLLPAVEQRLVVEMGESSDFLKQINIIGVSEQKGQKLGLGINAPIASRTNTDAKDRETTYAGSLSNDDYDCKQTNFDTHINYRVLDAWAVFEDFGQRYRAGVLKRMALDRIMIGWNGISAASETDRAANPLLQDVNVGWLEKVRINAPGRMMGYDSSGAETADEYEVGDGGTYNTLDALAFDMVSNLIEPWYQDGDDLIVIVGRELWVNHGLTLYNDNRAASERNALQVWFANEAVAGMKTITVPFFPSRGMVITSYDNLSLYYQANAVRRAIIDNPKRDRIEEYMSANDAYVIEDYGKFAGVRAGSVKLKNSAGDWV